MKSLFNPENFLWQWFGRVGDFFLVSCLWALCCMPVLTVGAATVALYDTVAHCIHGKEQAMFRRFFRTFKNELKPGCLMSVLWAVGGLVLNMAYQVVAQLTAGTSFSILGTACFMLLLIPVGICCWAVAIQSRFTYSFFALHRTAVLFTFGHLPHTAAIVFFFIAALNLVQNIPVLVMFIPGIAASLQAIFIEKVFAKYMPKEETA